MTSAYYPDKNKNNGQGSIILMFRDCAAHKHQFLSNFQPCDVTLPAETVLSKDGQSVFLPAMDFTSTEHAYMAWKTIDLEARQKIAAMSPGDAKKFSHQEDFPLRPDYSDEGRVETMRIVVEQKFSKRNPELRKMLLDTGDASLAEGNTWGDSFFGLDLTTGEGKNHLGQILMYVRDLVRAEEGLASVSAKASKKVAERKEAFKNRFKK